MLPPNNEYILQKHREEIHNIIIQQMMEYFGEQANPSRKEQSDMYHSLRKQIYAAIYRFRGRFNEMTVNIHDYSLTLKIPIDTIAYYKA